MANSYGPKSIVQDGLVFAVDPVNSLSWASPSSTDVNDLINPAITGSTINDNSPGPLDGGAGYFEFDGTSDYILFPDTDVVLPDSPYTYITAECWVNVTTMNNYGGIFAIGRPDGSVGIGLWTRSNNQLQWSVASSAGEIRPLVSSYLATYPGWRLITCTFDGTGVGGQIYIDGIARGVSYTSTGTFSTNNTYIMRIGTNLTNGFNGKVGSLKLYNRVLTQAEITQNYNVTKGRFS